MKTATFLQSLLVIFFLSSSAQAQKEKVENPIKNFDKLWKVFHERYANFELKKVDWQAVYDTYRPKVNEQTTNGELFEICCSMVQELNDGHVIINPRFKEEEKLECGPPYTFFYQREFNQKGEFDGFVETVNGTLSNNGFSELIEMPYTKNTKIRYATSADYGYLRISGMAENPTFGRLKRALDRALEASQDKKGLIIDVRMNGGGWDVTSYKIANRFADKKQIGHYKETRKKGKSTYKNFQIWELKPRGKYRFTKPIVILTSDFTASAAEIFLLAMHQLPHVTIVGDHSEGIFSDMMGFRLPNGWRVSLSHQKYYSRTMRNYEGLGIPPDHVATNTREDLKTGVDPVLQKGLEVLAEKQ